MRKFTQLKMLVIALFISTIAMAQGGGNTVNGVVTDASKLPMVGVSVTVDGTDDGTITGINGETRQLQYLKLSFRLPVP